MTRLFSRYLFFLLNASLAFCSTVSVLAVESSNADFRTTARRLERAFETGDLQTTALTLENFLNSARAATDRDEAFETALRLSDLYARRSRLRDATRLVEVAEELASDRPIELANAKEKRAEIYARLDSDVAAWNLLLEVWRFRRRNLPENDPALARSLNAVSEFAITTQYKIQTVPQEWRVKGPDTFSYAQEAGALLERAMEINVATYGKKSAQAAQTATNLALWLTLVASPVSSLEYDEEEAKKMDAANYARAEAYLRDAKAIVVELYGELSPEETPIVKAELILRRELAKNATDAPEKLTAANDAILQTLDRAIAIVEKNENSFADAAFFYAERMRERFEAAYDEIWIASALNEDREPTFDSPLFAQAVEDAQRCLDASQRFFDNYYGDAAELGKRLHGLRNEAAFSLAHYYYRTNRIEQFFHTIESIRATALLNAFAQRETDAFERLPEATKTRLKTRRDAAERRLNSAQTQLNACVVDPRVTSRQRLGRVYDLNREIVAARQEAQAVYAETDAALAAFGDAQRASLDFQNVIAELKASKTLALEYVVFSTQGSTALQSLFAEDSKFDELYNDINVEDAPSCYLLAYGFGLDEPKLTPLETSPALFELTRRVVPEWGTRPGPLRALDLQAIVSSPAFGLLANLSDQFDASSEARPFSEKKLTSALNLFYALLVPDAEVREALTNGECERALIVPDGPLALFPFEALVISPSENAYFLDVCPPVVYTPSLAVWSRLTERERADAARTGGVALDAALSIGAPVYPKIDEYAQDFQESVARQTALLNVDFLRRLEALPATGAESDAVVAAFRRASTRTTQFKGEDATEANLRRAVAGKKLLHVACHGLLDRSFGNVFGALATTPGDALDPQNDGLITTRELSELDLSSCELAILSACDVGAGTTQIGEGAWSIGRCAMVAGSKRVVSTAWSIDDAATSFGIARFAETLAESPESSIDYAAALRDAKQALKQRREAPRYWAPFMLWGI